MVGSKEMVWLILKTYSKVSWSLSCNGCVLQSLKSFLGGRQLKMQVVSSWIFGKITLHSIWGEIRGLGKKPRGAFLYFSLFGISTLSSCLKPYAEMLSFVQWIRSCCQALSSWFGWVYFLKDAWNGHILNNSCVYVWTHMLLSFSTLSFFMVPWGSRHTLQYNLICCSTRLSRSCCSSDRNWEVSINILPINDITHPWSSFRSSLPVLTTVPKCCFLLFFLCS